jgi:Flp pilus assembly protein TadG
MTTSAPTPFVMRARDERGMAAVEFALLLPAFLFLIISIMQFGQALWTQAALEHAVTMASRCASVDTTSCTTTNSGAAITTYAFTQAYGVNLPSGTFSFAQASNQNCVSASYPFPVSPFLTLNGFLPSGISTISLKAKSCYPVVPP